MSPEKLKKQLEELMLFQVEQDIIDCTHSKSEFAPYVVVALSKGISRDKVAEDVLSQLDKQIELEKTFPVHKRPSFIKKVKSWILKNLLKKS